MSAHTPGPWKVINHPRVAHVDSMRSVGHGANGMASIVWLTGGALAQEANARLIAAAPDLLAALEELKYRDLEDGPCWCRSIFDLAARGGQHLGYCETARAAFAKARGGK